MNLDSFKAGKEDIRFWSFTGEVISQNKYSETHVWSSGGGGHLGPRGGHVAAAQTHSSVTTKQEFWLKLDDGTEKSVQLGGYDIPLRESQKISILMAQTETSESAYYAALINHTSSKTHTILSADSILDNLIDFNPKPLDSFIWFLMKLIFPFALILSLSATYMKGSDQENLMGWTFIIGCIYVPIRILLYNPSKKNRGKFIKPFSEHIANLNTKLVQQKKI
jgi:hypothetical protein